jgi:TRAP-type C4-dicarboxylate transport system permease small subunit
MLFTAALITLAGVGAELATLGALASLSTTTGTERGFIYLALFAAAAVVALYAAFTTRALVRSQPDPAGPRSAISGAGSASLVL